MLKRCLPFALLVTAIAMIGSVSAQLPPPPPGKPPDPLAILQKLVGAKGAELDQAVRGVSAYPQRTRNAILDLAKHAEKHPTLLADLAKLRTATPAAVDQYLTSNKYEPELQHAAALVMVEAPETIDQMKARPDLVRIVGVAWSTPPGRDLISAVLEKAHAAQEKARSASADRWASRLKADPKLMQQYVQLLEDYTQRAHEGKTDETWESYGYGVTKSKDGYVVNDVPSTEIINYALALGAQYQAVVSALIQQYLNGTNQDDYNAAVGGWYSTYGGSVPQSTQSSNSDYYALLQELSALAEAAYSNYTGGSGSGYGSGGYSNGYGDSYGSGSGDTGSGDGNTVNAVGNIIANNGNQYPKLTDWKAKNPAPKLGSPTDLSRLKDGPLSKPPFDPGKGPNANPFTERLKGTPPNQRALPMAQGGQNPFALAAKKPGPNVGGGKPPAGPQQMFRGSPPMGQQLARAQGQMKGAWRPPQGRGPGGPPKK